MASTAPLLPIVDDDSVAATTTAPATAVAQRLPPGSKRRHVAPLYTRLFFAEVLGTGVLMLFGLGVCAQVTLSRRLTSPPAGDYLSINVGWGLGVAAGVLVAGTASGAHLNPAVTVTLAATRRLPWRQVPVYVVAQVVGAFVAAGVVNGVYVDALDAFDGGRRQVTGTNATAGIFATYPQPYLSTANGFADQVVGTMVLLLVALAVGDKANNVSLPAAAAAMGATVLGIGVAFGVNAGYAINPARDFGPRLFTAAAGWGSAVFSAGHHWWWVPIVAPCVGGVLAGALYHVFIVVHQDKRPLHGD